MPKNRNSSLLLGRSLALVSLVLNLAGCGGFCDWSGGPKGMPGAPCEGRSVTHTEGNDAYVTFKLEPFPEPPHNEPTGMFKWPEGTVKRFADGSHYTYKFPACRRVQWRGVSFTCLAGRWAMASSAIFLNDAHCYGNTADGPENHVACGVR